MNTRNNEGWVTGVAMTLALLIPVGGALAHGSSESGKHGTMGSDSSKHAGMQMPMDSEEHAFGKASDPAMAKRMIEVNMSDALRFEPGTIEVAQGEPVRFVVRNQGKLMHEMVLGTKDALEQHAAMMKKFPGMEHAEPYMAHVEPGKSGEMGWTFTRAGEYFYGCLVPGHYEGGMVGRIIVK